MRIRLALLPTPVQRLGRLGAELGIDLWVKRDDLTGLGLSGNKVRKLEYLLHDAVEQGADCVLTCGGAQSNHARATAVAARRLGLHPGLLLRGVPGLVRGNLLINELVAADVRWCGAEDYASRREELLADWADELRGQGRSAYIIPEGGSNALGSLGYVQAAAELREQLEADHVVVPVGSGGTLAGLVAGGVHGTLHGVAVCDDAAFFEAKVRQICEELTHVSDHQPRERWRVLDAYKGPAYGVATPAMHATIRRVARTEGLFLDTSYTGKAMHALIEEAKAGRLTGRVLFWHTGGAFSLFAQGPELLE